MRNILRLSLATAALAISVSAQAELLYGVTFDNQLITFDSTAPTQLLSGRAITGIGGSDLVGIDFRPSTGVLYGLTTSSNLITINTNTGVATTVGALTTQLNGSNFGFSFNPVVDRIRVTSDVRQNLRVDPSNGSTIVDGEINYVDGTTTLPQVTATGYTNPVSGTTTLYGIDAANNSLVSFNSANAGTITRIGGTGLNNSGLQKMVIAPSGTAYASIQPVGISGSQLFTVNLGTGATTNLGVIGPGGAVLQLRGLAAAPVPEPTTIAGIGLGLAALARRRRKNS